MGLYKYSNFEKVYKHFDRISMGHDEDDIAILNKEKILTAHSKMLKYIDTIMTEVYWYVGKITYELSENSTKASYGKKIIDALSVKFTNEFGSVFSPVSIKRMRKFYEIYKIWSAVPNKLSWSHLTHQDIGQM